MFTTNTTTSATSSATSNSRIHSVQPMSTTLGNGIGASGAMPVLTPQLPLTPSTPSTSGRGGGVSNPLLAAGPMSSSAQASTNQLWNNLLANLAAQQCQQQQMAAISSTGPQHFIDGIVPYPTVTMPHGSASRSNSALTNELLTQMLTQATAAGSQQLPCHQPSLSIQASTTSSSSSSVFDPSALPNMTWLSQTLASIYGYDQLKQILLEHQQAQQRQHQTALLSQLLFGVGGVGSTATAGLSSVNQADIMRLADATQALINLNSGGGGASRGRDRSCAGVGQCDQQQMGPEQPLDLSMSMQSAGRWQPTNGGQAHHHQSLSGGRKNSRAGRTTGQQQAHLPPTSLSAIGHRPASVIHSSSSSMHQHFGLPAGSRGGGSTSGPGASGSVKRSASSVSHLLSPCSLLKPGGCGGGGGDEPDVGEHFRRSLSGKWPRRIHNQPHHHYASTPAATRKSSGAGGQQCASKCRSIYYNEATASVEDHFRKALGDDYRQRYFSSKDAPSGAESTTATTTSTTSINECGSTAAATAMGSEKLEEAHERMDQDGEHATSWLNVVDDPPIEDPLASERKPTAIGGGHDDGGDDMRGE